MGHAEDINRARGLIMAGKRWGKPELARQGYAILRRVRIERAQAVLDEANAEIPAESDRPGEVTS